MTQFITTRDWGNLYDDFNSGSPFKHVIIDNFFTPEIAQKIVDEFPKDYDSPVWSARYNNPVEKKRTCNHWDSFPSTTYRVFDYLCGDGFTKIIEQITGRTDVKGDIGLHGGGWHCHQRGDKLNIHYDYSIHPKLNLERHYNLIVYMTPDWEKSWGGGLELWNHNVETNQPLECITTVENKFNRAVLFDTTQHSWHGLPREIECPIGVCRTSLAVYYLTPPEPNADPRGKALYAPYKDQVNDPEVLELIRKRSQS